MRLGWSFPGVVWMVGCASASTYLPDTEPAVPGLAPRHDDPKSCIQGPEADLPPSPQEMWHREVKARAVGARSCTRKLGGLGPAGLSVHAAPNEKADVRVVQAAGYDCATVACIKRSFADLPSPPSVQNFTLRFSPQDDAGPPSGEGNAGTPLTQPSCLDPPRPGETPNEASEGGRLPPEDIQAIVRASYGEFRRCYEDGLARDPNLTGKVTTGFVIDTDGRVSSVRTLGNTVPDCLVAACVRTRFARLVFPKPVGGIVTVVYPIMLETRPGNAPKPAPVARPHGP